MLAVASRPGRADSAKPATAGRLDDEHVTGVHLCFVRSAEVLDAAVDALDPVLAGRSRLTAGEPERRDLAMIREQHSSHRLQKPHAASRAVAAAMTPCSARAATDMEIIEPHWEAPLQHFGIGQARIRHVSL